MAEITKQKKEMDMTHGPLVGKIILYTIPLMVSGILQLCFNAADVIVVGRYGSDASLAAVGSNGALINLIINLFMGLSVGVSVNVAHAWGAKRDDIVANTVHTAMLTALLSGIIVMFIGFFGARTFLTWMDTPANVIDLSTIYIKIYFLGMPANMIYNFGAAILRSIGDTKRPLIFLIIAGIVNVLLNLLLVIVFQLDVAGVAIATVISQVVSAILVVVFLMKQDNCCRLHLSKLRIHWDRLVAIARIGIPSGIQGSLFSISNVLIQSSINSFGSVAMEGNTAASNLEGFVYIAMNSFYHTSLTFVGQNVGAKQYHRLLRVLAICLVLVVSLGLTLGLLVYTLGEPLLSIYSSNPSPEMLAFGLERLSVVVTMYFLCGMMETFTGMLRGMGASLTPMIISLVGACLSRVVWIYTVFAAHRSLFVLYISWPLSWTLTVSIQIVAVVILYRRLKKKDAPIIPSETVA